MERLDNPTRGARGASWPRRVALVVLVALLGSTGVAWIALRPAPGVAEGSRVVDIPRDSGLAEVADHLAGAEVIRSRVAFMVAAAARGTARRLRAGEYEVPREASTLDVLELLESGRVIHHVVLHREGATLDDLARTLEAQKLATAADVGRAGRDPALLRRLDVPGTSLEGYLFPDTYEVVRGMKPEELLARMVARTREHITPAVLERMTAQRLTLHQVLTMASIIEREAARPGEMPLISAVFWNRLRRDMPLQADPTVQYAIGRMDRAPTRADLEVDSPYNTYRRAGLPPGPIASPGRAAIEAAVRPAEVGYLYFVMSAEGQHHFSTTLVDHQAAVARYRAFRQR